MDLVFPSVVHTEHTDIHLQSKPVGKEGNQTGVDTKLYRISLVVGSENMFSTGIEGLALLE